MTVVPELRKTPLAVEIQPTPAEPFVEVRVGQRLMAVTIQAPGLSADDAELTVTRASLRLRARSGGLDVFLPLPMTAEPGRYWVRFNHGVCDVLVARAETSR